MSDNQIPGDERVTPAPQPEETVGQFLDRKTDSEVAADMAQEVRGIQSGYINPIKLGERDPKQGSASIFDEAATLSRSGYIDPGTSTTRAAVVGAVSSLMNWHQNLDQTGHWVTDIPGSAVEGVLRAGQETINLVPDLINAATGAGLPRLEADFDPEDEYASVVSDLTSGATQFLTYFIPVGGQLRGVAKGASSRMGLGSVRVGRNRAGGAAAVEYALSAAGGGMVADFVAFDPAEGNLSSMIRNTEWAKNNPEIDGLLSMLDSREYVNEDDPAGYLKGRFALAIEGAGIGLLADFGLKQLGRAAGVAVDAGKTVRSKATQRAVNQAGAFLLARAKMAEDFIADGGDVQMLELHLGRNGLGFAEMKQKHILPAMANVLADDFNVPVADAQRIVNAMVNGGLDPARVFAPGRGGSTIGNRIPVLLQELDFREVQRQVSERRASEAQDLGGTALTQFAENAANTTQKMVPRAPKFLQSLGPMPREELLAKIEDGITAKGGYDKPQVSRDEMVFGGYMDLIEETPEGSIVDPGSIVSRARGVHLYEYRRTKSDYRRFTAGGTPATKRDYFELLIGGDAHMLGDDLLPPGFSLKEEKGGLSTLFSPEGVPVAGGFTSELDVYFKFSSPGGGRGIESVAPEIANTIRDYYGQMQGRHFFDEEAVSPVIAHARFTTRQAGGNALYMEEAQSDLFNEVKLGRMETGSEGQVRGDRANVQGYGITDPVTGEPSRLWMRILARRIVAYAIQNGFDKVIVPTDKTVRETMSSGLPRKVDPSDGKIRDVQPALDPGAVDQTETFLEGPAEALSPKSKFYEQLGSLMAKEFDNLTGSTNKQDAQMVEVPLGKVEGSAFQVRNLETDEIVGTFSDKEKADDFIFELESDPENAEFIPDEGLFTSEPSSGTVEKARGKQIRVGPEVPQFFELLQRDGTAKGMAAVDQQTGVALIRGLEGGDISTLIHELGHAMHIQMIARNSPEEMDRLREVFGELTETEQYENFARSLEAFMRDPSGVPAAEARAMERIAAQMRDVYNDIVGTPLEGRLNAEQREFFEGLQLRTDLPVQYAPGKFMKRANFAPVIARIRQIEENGEDWRAQLDPKDILATARYKSSGDTGPGPIRNLGFDMESEEDVLKQLAIFEQLYRDLQREGITSSNMTSDERSLRAMQLFNKTADRDMTDVLDDVMVSDARKPGQGAVNIEAMQMLMNAQLQKILDLRDAVKADGTTTSMARFHRALMQFQVLHSNAQMLRYQSGLDLAAWRNTFKMPSDAELADVATADAFIDALGDRATGTQDLIGLIDNIGRSPDGYADLADRVRIINETGGSMSRSVLMEIYVNGLLSAPRTMLGLSLVSPALSMAMDGTSRLIGAASRLDGETASDVGANLVRNVLNVGEAARYALKVLREEQPQLIQSSIRDDAMDPRAIRSRAIDPTMVDHGINLLGRFVRIPTSTIATFDEFYKQLNARTTIQSRLMQEHKQAVLNEAVAAGRLSADATPAERTRYVWERRDQINEAVEVEFEDVIRNGRLRDRQAISDEALQDPIIRAIENPKEQLKAVKEYVDNQFDGRQSSLVENADRAARRHVFQEELGDTGKKVQALLGKKFKGIPIGRVIVPFFRTPVNILKRFGEYYPGALIEAYGRKGVRFATGRGFNLGDTQMYTFHTKMLNELNSPDASVRASAEGRMALGLGVLTSAYFLHEQGLITGGGPENRDLKKAMQQGGWQPYSIRIGDQYYSYEKLEPMAFHLGIIADTFEYMEADVSEEEETGLFTGMLYSTSRMLESKSYLQGVSDLFNAFEDPKKFGERYIRNLIGSFVPFSSFARNFRGTIDPIIYENRDILDQARYNTFLGQEKLPPRRTIIGDAITRVPNDTPGYVPWVNFISPIRVGQLTKDPVYRFLAENEEAIGMPSKKYEDIDWTTMPGPEGFVGTAYDYFTREVGRVKLGSKLLRTRLDEMISPDGSKHKSFLRSLARPTEPGKSNEGIQRIREMITDARDLARRNTLEAIPELRAAHDRRMLEFHEARLRDKQSRNENTEFVEKTVEKLRGGLIGSP